MKLPLSWIKEYSNLPSAPEEIADILTLAGLEVDGIYPSEFAFNGVIIAKIVSVKPHPDAEKLRIAEVFDGKESYQVVCGAPNCREDLLTAFAPAGSFIDGKKIKKGKLRGIESFGMLCGADELGLSGDPSGIMELEGDLGTPLASLYGDTIIEITLTPNLGHCTSVLGVARELAALTNTKYKKPQKVLDVSGKATLSASVKERALCPRYCAMRISGVRVEQSPEWLVTRLEACGMRSVNNIVDATNYVMLELGQPMHAFDAAKVSGDICVKPAEKELSMVTLDDHERKIPKGTLLIFDDEKPLAVAGVIGGKNSEVSDTTTDIILEAACFNPSSVRWSSKQLGTRTESSNRFEKGSDQNGAPLALAKAAKLIGGSAEPIVDIGGDAPLTQLSVRLERINGLLGTELSLGEVEALYKRLEMGVTTKETTLHVTVPSYRNDCKAEIDLIEEAARVYGYNTIEKSEPRTVISSLPHSEIYLLENKMRSLLLGEGLQEFVTCDLISPKQSKVTLEKSMPESALIHVLKPSSVDQSILRPSLLPSMLYCVKHNFDHQVRDISAFELGRIHFKSDGVCKERLCASILLTGKSGPHFWGEKPRMWDFFDIKGMIENIIDADISFVRSKLESFHPGVQAQIVAGDVSLGVVGQIHPGRLLEFDIEAPLYFAQIDLHDLLPLLPPLKQMSPLPLFPGSERDWTFTASTELEIGQVFDAIDSIPSKLLKDRELRDIYKSEKLGIDKQNITLRFVYRNDKKTVQQLAVDKEHARITETILTKIPPSLHCGG